MAYLLTNKSNKRHPLWLAIGFLLIAGMIAPSLPAFAAAERPTQTQAHDQLFRFIEGVRGKTTAQRYTALILKSAKTYGIHPMLVANLILTESSFNAKAISPMGAIGLMQVMPFHYTKRRIPVSKWHDPAINIDLGCQIFSSYAAMMRKRYPGLNPSAVQHRALVAYNMGPRAVVSRGIYRSHYSQKVFREGALLIAAPRPARRIPVAPPAPKPEPLDLTPIPWEQLPLSNSSLSVEPGKETADSLRIGYSLPETVFLRPSDASDFSLHVAGDAGTP